MHIYISIENGYIICQILNTVTNRARIYQWVEAYRLEMKLFLSLLFHMGTIKPISIQDYCKTYPLFNLSIFRARVSRNRFMILFRTLHFARNSKEGEPAPRNRLYKIQPIVNLFNLTINEIYEPSKNLPLVLCLVGDS